MDKLMCKPCLVITSWPDLDGARQQASHWVENKLAARLNILPQMDSIICLGSRTARWRRAQENHQELRDGAEHKKIIKTCAVAEVLHFRVDSGGTDFLNWMTISTQ
jgi:uncharacterized protein involved in tolerance to divalent cations